MTRLLTALACLLLTLPAFGQQPTLLDTTRVYELETAIVTADRSQSVLSSSTSAVSVISGAELRKLPVVELKDALETTPGFAFLQVDGLGLNPQATVRGFYGGGETEYVVLLLDGKPLNHLSHGLVNWNLVPIESIERVEVLRGGASSLYGDAAIGSVVNLVTDGSRAPVTRLSAYGGSYGSFEGDLSHSGRFGSRSYSIFGAGRVVDGYRDHAEREEFSLGGSVDLAQSPHGGIRLSTLHHVRSFDDPGPLTPAELADDRTVILPFFRFDGTDDRTHRLSLDGDRQIASAALVSGALTGEVRSAETIRTIPLAPGFADTKERVTDATRMLATAQVTFTDVPLDGKLTLGTDAAIGSLDSDYYNFLIGPAEVYTGQGQRGDLDRSGSADRRMAAGFAQLDLHPVDRVRLTVGARADWIRDSYRPTVPTDGEEINSSNSAFSPKAGINVRYVGTAQHVGNLYANVSQSFKAPTLDQLYDQRTYPFDPSFPPITISNGELKPQYGTSVELGVYHHANLSPGLLAADVSAAVYHIDMKDELDFSFETFRNENIAESRHRGLETGLKLYVRQRVTAFANYTYQGVTTEGDAGDRLFVKAIPRDFIGAGLSATHPSGLQAAFKLSAARRIYLDDPNTIDLPDYTTVDVRLGYQFDRFGVSFDVFNLLDESYSATGYPDPAGTSLVYYYPAAGRFVRAGLSLTL